MSYVEGVLIIINVFVILYIIIWYKVLIIMFYIVCKHILREGNLCTVKDGYYADENSEEIK